MHHDHVMALAQMRHEKYQQIARDAARTSASAPKRRRPLLARRLRVASRVAVDARAATAPRP